MIRIGKRVGPPLAALAIAGAAFAQDLGLEDLERMFPAVDELSHMDLADVDGDQDLDAALSTWHGLFLARQTDPGRYELDDAPLPDTQVPYLQSRVVLFDADGDGDSDLYFGREGTDELFRNDGAGGFAASGLMPAEFDAPIDADAGDLDGDGDLDLYLLIEFFSASGRLLRNGGPSGFTLEFTLGRGISADLADVDGDGDLDVLRAEEGFCDIEAGCFPGKTRLALNDGTGQLTEAPFPSTATWAGSVHFGDVDLDGAPDALVTNTGGHPTALFQNQGAGIFADVSTALPAQVGSGDAALLDFETDGDPDLFLSSGHLFTNAGGLVFSDESGRLPSTGVPSFRSIFGDMDGDGDDDLLVGGSAPHALFQDATDHFVDVSPYQPTEVPGSFGVSSWISLGDFDGDGYTDGIRASKKDVVPLTNDGAGALQPGPPIYTSGGFFVQAAELGDLDGDGDLDVYAADRSAPDGLLLGDGAGGFADVSAGLPTIDPHSQSAALIDVDADGDLDVVLPGSVAGVGTRLLANVGQANLIAVPEADFPKGDESTYDVAAADLDLDGDLDLVLATSSPSSLGSSVYPVQRYENLGDGTWLLHSSVLPDVRNARGVGAADVDADGDADVLFRQVIHDDVLVEGDGAGGFLASSLLPAASSTGGPRARFADLDEDGDLDAVTGRLWENTGAGFVDATPAAFLPIFGSMGAYVDVADLDGDGDLDVLWDGRRQLANTLRQAAWAALPSPGREARVDVFGGAGEPWILGLSTGVAELPIPPLGTLRLDPVGLHFAEIGALDVEGEARHRIAVPPGSSLVGVDVHWQALVGAVPLLTNRTSTSVHDL